MDHPNNGRPWNQWATLARAALDEQYAVPFDELLLMRDASGQNVRPLEPPHGTTPRIGAVLILLYPDGDNLRLPLTVRSDRLPNHRGEVSLPGGATDPEDVGPAGTALRECFEELGIPAELPQIWGQLSPIYIRPSNFRITPVVGFSETLPPLAVNEAEVSHVITASLPELMNPQTVSVELRTFREVAVHVPFFNIAGHKVWGATALILSEFVARMRRVQAIAQR